MNVTGRGKLTMAPDGVMTALGRFPQDPGESWGKGSSDQGAAATKNEARGPGADLYPMSLTAST